MEGRDAAAVGLRPVRGAGSGITPLHSIARYVLDGGIEGGEALMYYSVKTPKDIIYEKLIEGTAPTRHDELAQRLQSETAKLGEVARKKDEAGVKQQYAAVGKVCGACHEGFREK